MAEGAPRRLRFTAISPFPAGQGEWRHETPWRLSSQQVAPNDVAVRLILGLTLFATVFLQKLAVPSTDGAISVILPVMYVAMVGLAVTRALTVSIGNLLLYTLTLLAAVIGQLLSSRPFSGGSVLLLFVTYLPFTVRAYVPWRVILGVFRQFQSFMVVGCVLALFQHLWQLIFGVASVPNLESFIPDGMLMKGFVYIQSIYYQSEYIKPNGIFFLEVSFLSQFAAMALVVELVYFQKMWRILLFGGSLIAIFAGTGPLLLMLVSPLIVARLPPRRIVVLGLAALAVLAVALTFGWYDQIDQRLGEFDSQNTSGYYRFVDPWVRLLEFARTDEAWYTGRGAGSTPRVEGVVWWALTKLATEYGFLTAILFHVFFIRALFERAPSKRIAVALLVMFSILGSNLLSFPVLALCLVFGTLLRPLDQLIPEEAAAPELEAGEPNLVASRQAP